MNRFVKIILIVLLYVMLFISAFGLITYFNALQVLPSIQSQLFIGIGSLVSAILLIIVLINSEGSKTKKSGGKNKKNKDIGKKTEDVQMQMNLDNRIVEEQPAQALQRETNQKDNSEFNETQELYFSTAKISALKANEVHLEENVRHSSEKNDDESNEKEKVKDNGIEYEDTGENPQITRQIVNADLTETQIMYINQSENSYINEQGQPQLMITEEYSSSLIKKQISEKLAQHVEKESEEEQNRLLDAEEKSEKVQNALEKLIVVWVLLIVIMSVYFALSTFVG